MRIGARVTLGHNARVFGATIDERSMIAIGATVLPGAHVGAHSIVAANATVPEGMDVPPRTLVIGNGRMLREVTEAEIDAHRERRHRATPVSAANTVAAAPLSERIAPSASAHRSVSCALLGRRVAQAAPRRTADVAVVGKLDALGHQRVGRHDAARADVRGAQHQAAVLDPHAVAQRAGVHHDVVAEPHVAPDPRGRCASRRGSSSRARCETARRPRCGSDRRAAPRSTRARAGPATLTLPTHIGVVGETDASRRRVGTCSR